MIADNYVPAKTLGNGVTTSFSFGWAIIAAANLRVYLEDKDTGVQTLVTSGITVTFNDATPGGTVVFDTAPTSQYYVIRAREIPQANTVGLKTASGFQGGVIEALFDKVVAMVQDAYSLASRGLQLPLGSIASPIIPSPEAGKAIIGNDAEDGFTNSSVDLETLAEDVADVEQAVLDAQAAKTAAETAQGLAEAAQTAAETAETNAETAETNAETAETNAEAAQSAAETARDLAQNYAAALVGTSTSSVAIGTGEKTFTTQSGKQFQAGQILLIASQADVSNYMLGQVTSYSSTTLVVNVTTTNGTGTFADWNISIGGGQGPQGEQGDAGDKGDDGDPVNWLGAYASGTTYSPLDAVSYNGSSYICILESTGNLPTNATYWNVMAAKGTDGEGAGDVLGPATNTDSYVPQWDGVNSKTLKNGLAVGTSANNLVQLDGSAKLPAVDGSQLTNLPGGDVVQADLDPIRDNIALLAFRQQANDGVTIQKMEDGVVDEYEDESGIDTSASTNESYDATNDFYSPTTAYDSSVKLLLHCDGNDGSATFTDEIGKTVTPQGNAQIDTAAKKFGTASCLLDGTGDYLSIPDSADWNFSTGNFTIEMWARPQSSTVPQWFLSQYVDNDNTWRFGFQNSTYPILTFQVYSGGNALISLLYDIGETLDTTQFKHYAVVRNGDVFTMYVNGVSVATSTAAITIPDLAAALEIGYSRRGGNYWNGWLDEIRISKSAIYTANFTPASAAFAPTANNMTLISQAFTAVEQPDVVRAIIFEENVDSVTINTDLLVYASRDGGTTYTQGTLVNEGLYDASRNILSCNIDVSAQPAGTSVKYKLVTANNKNMKIHGTGVLWR